MTTYLERLKARTLQKHIPKEPSKPSKGAFEGFDGDQGRCVSENDRVGTAGKCFPTDKLAESERLESSSSAADDADLQIAYVERQAICEIDGGLKRTEAALLSTACVVPLREGETAESRQATVLHFAEHLDRLRRRRVLPTREPGDAA